MFGIDDAIAAVANVGKAAIDKIWPDATEVERNKANQLLTELQGEISLQLGQLRINEEEAKHGSTFVAGARPYILWGMGTSLILSANYWLISWVAVCFGLPPVPIPDTGLAVSFVSGMLGLAGMRSYDKLKGTDTKKIGK